MIVSKRRVQLRKLKLLAFLLFVTLLLLPIAVSFAQSADYSNSIQLTGDSVHAYSANTLYVTQQASSTYSNYLYVQTYGFVLNPLKNGDPNFDYYIFDTIVSSTANSNNEWYVTSNGFSDEHGPSISLTVNCVGSESVYEQPTP